MIDRGTLRSTAIATASRHAYGDAIQWEELPSLAGALARRESPTDAARASRVPTVSRAAAWVETMPACFDPGVSSGPFREALEGLSTREVGEPDVFRHFFGQSVVE